MGANPVNIAPDYLLRLLQRAFAGVLLLGMATAATAQAPIVQPGAPGESARELTAEEAANIAVMSHSPDDVRFMQDMIPHHNQAVQMAELVEDRTNRPEVVDAAGRITLSQQDEMEFMERWLNDRGEQAPEPTDHDAMHTSHRMAGMATPEQMAELAASEGTDFDRMFLQLMITHHEGAVTMVEDLLEQPGSAYDPMLFEFANDVTNDQTAEIERMHALLITLSDDPRAGLAAGFDDAGQALMNMELVASLPKPPGFYDLENPAELPPERPRDDDGDTDSEGEDAEDRDEDGDNGDREDADDGEDEEDDGEWDRSPLLNFSNSDMAFRDDVLFAGSYHGFNIYRLDEGGLPEQISSVVCPGGQGDVSVVGDLLILSVEQTRGRLDCGLEGIVEDVSDDRFRGIRIFDIGDLTRPVQVGAVQTCRGSHTHSVVTADDERIIVYNSGTSRIREEEELEGCIDESPGDYRTALFRIDVIEIPVDNPAGARIVHSPAVFADPEDGTLAGLWRGGDHGDETQESRPTDECHDITVFPELGIAAGACSGNGILFDISDPLNPQRMDEVVDQGFAYWHSATFNNDATKVLFTDEWGGGGMPRCRAFDPLDWGADAIYDIVDGQLEFRSYFKIPAPQTEQENCVAHHGSAYWYQGKIYGTEIVRGLDVLSLTPSEFLSENEIAAAALADQGSLFNPQQQLKYDWPADPAVARAYLDQLARSDEVSVSFTADLDTALSRTESALQEGSGDEELAARLESLAAVLESGDDGITTRRQAALAETLGGIAARLR
ncbi:MAG: DUF305 domain-containing protein [Proteobacteria bacterium]|nr:DUF305 domain-containing protein [Pseudomonadota bacterium]